MLNYFCVSIIHGGTLTWATRSLTSVSDLYECVLSHSRASSVYISSEGLISALLRSLHLSKLLISSNEYIILNQISSLKRKRFCHKIIIEIQIVFWQVRLTQKRRSYNILYEKSTLNTRLFIDYCKYKLLREVQ